MLKLSHFWRHCMQNFFNSGLTQQQFLDEYWQKKPLLIRQAFVDFKSPISADELAGLACEADIESRLIKERGAEPWQVTCGPLEPEDFESLPETHWTILVQDVDKHIPSLQPLLAPFKFIPDWRRDDLMISFAPEGGSVGAHTDSYDVFLLQAMGTRRWQIMHEPVYEAKLVDGIELKILAEFAADETWELEPGDMLYLPPNIAHYGVALNDCMTFSIGFQAPRQIEILDSLVNTCLEKGLDGRYYADRDLALAEQGSELTPQAIQRTKDLLHDLIEQSDDLLAESLGKLVTKVKPSLYEVAFLPDYELSTPHLAKYFTQGDCYKNHYLQFAWSSHAEGGWLFSGGESYAVDKAGIPFLALLCEKTVLTEQDWFDINKNQSVVDVLRALILNSGWFFKIEVEYYDD